jgi:hypothetical protein
MLNNVIFSTLKKIHPPIFIKNLEVVLLGLTQWPKLDYNIFKAVEFLKTCKTTIILAITWIAKIQLLSLEYLGWRKSKLL